jgi:hypothetical protein
VSNAAIDDFIERAQKVSVTEAAERLHLPHPKGERGTAWSSDRGQACPRAGCGGKDRFSINAGKQVWNCRRCGGGATGISLAGHVFSFNLHTRSDFFECCSIVLGEPIPEGGERETDAQRADREKRMADSRADAARNVQRKAWKAEALRIQEIDKARGMYLRACEAPHPDDGPLREYFRLRTGCEMPAGVFECLRFSSRHTYWHGQDERGNPISRYVGYAMLAPFVDLTGRIVGSHATWIDVSNGPKFRPELRDEDGALLPTKKMRGSKKGGLIPICGDMASNRWMGGEGIENVAAVGGIEGFRADTFYYATGDLGNLAGPADPKSAFPHPHETTMDRRERIYAVRVPGPIPKPGQTATDAYQVPDYVRELIHLADGDSERVFTAAAMARAEARLSRDNLDLDTWWPPEGEDFAGAVSRARMKSGA